MTFLSDRVWIWAALLTARLYPVGENAMGIQVQNAQMIRAILLEVERLPASVLGLAVTTGFDSGFMQFFRVRETS